MLKNLFVLFFTTSIVLCFSLSPVLANAALNIGFDFNGEVKSTSILGEKTTESQTSFCIGGEQYFIKTDNLDFGIGIEGLIPQHPSDKGRFYNIPTYFVIDYYFTNSQKAFTPYVVSRLGYNYIYVDSLKNGYKQLSGGPYYGVGIGVKLKNLWRNSSIEILYSKASSKITVSTIITDIKTDMKFGKYNIIYQIRI